MATATLAPVEEKETASTGEDAEDLSLVKLCESRGIYGIVTNPNRSYVTVLERNYYNETTTLTRGRGKGKVYEAGTYGPWQLVGAKYYPTVAMALRYVADRLVGLYMAEDEASDLRNLADVADRVRADIFSHYDK